MNIINRTIIKPMRVRLAELWEKRNKVATENFVRCLALEARIQGFNLDDGDRCFIHPEDLPRTVKLKAGMPVIASTAPAMVRGRLLFAKRHQIPQCLERDPIYVQAPNGVHLVN